MSNSWKGEKVYQPIQSCLLLPLQVLFVIFGGALFHVLPFQYNRMLSFYICMQRPDDYDSLRGGPPQITLREMIYSSCAQSTALPEAVTHNFAPSAQGLSEPLPASLSVHNKLLRTSSCGTLFFPNVQLSINLSLRQLMGASAGQVPLQSMLK